MKRIRNWIAFVVRAGGGASFPDSGHVHGLEKVSQDKSWALHPEDVHLIAAAPELEEACEEFERYFDTDYEEMNEAFKTLREKVKAAIQKAKGREQAP